MQLKAESSQGGVPINLGNLGRSVAHYGSEQRVQKMTGGRKRTDGSPMLSATDDHRLHWRLNRVTSAERKSRKRPYLQHIEHQNHARSSTWGNSYPEISFMHNVNRRNPSLKSPPFRCNCSSSVHFREGERVK